MVTDETDDSPEDTTVTRGAVVIAVVENLRHNELQEHARRSIWTPHVLMPPKLPTDGEHPPNPQHKGNIPCITCRYPQNIQMHGQAN